MFVAVLGLLFAADPLPAPPRLTEPAEPTPPLQRPALPPKVSVATIADDSVRLALEPHIGHLQGCAAASSRWASPGKPGDWPQGQITFAVTVRRGKATFAVLSAADPGVEWLEPCLETELVHVDWPIRRGRFEVPVTVGEPTATP